MLPEGAVTKKMPAPAPFSDLQLSTEKENGIHKLKNEKKSALI